ncbi:MAG: ATP-binding protein [Spirochaetales bacterium]|nr:ATP-binding protein [Spirochaetales bacterium]
MSEIKDGQMFLGYTEKELQPKYFSTLDHIERIVDYAQSLGIQEPLFEKAGSHIDILAERLGVSPMQAVLFSLLFSRYDNACRNEELAQLFRCSPIKLLRYMNDLEELQKKKLLASRRPRGEAPIFKVPLEVVNSLRKKDVFTPEVHRNITIDEFFGILDDLFGQMLSEEMDSEALNEELKILVENNMQLLFCQKLMSYNFDQEDVLLLLCFCHLCVNNHDDNIGWHDFGFLYDKKSEARYVLRELKEGDHTLMETEFIENANADGFLNKEAFKLTDKAKKDLLGELEISSLRVNSKKGLILWDAITPKKLFYNEKEGRGIQEFASLLREENFKKIRERLEHGGMRKGFACLFSGGPGTGKTETVYQIAKETQRNIMQVDIAAIKDMWVGETEKHMKEVFDNYRGAVSASEAAPILLFNEADAVIGKRIEFTGSSRAVDRMENTMQNIILQELESLDGILIATTNLSRNMDRAFERRFLYKIEFEKPGREVRARIWRTMLNTLSADEAGELAARFDFSGGQIENVVRKCAVAGVLSGSSPSFKALLLLCNEEISSGESGGGRIGFGT